MSDAQGIGGIFGGAFVLSLAILVIVARQSSALQKQLLPLVTSFGWERLRRRWWPGSMRGLWRGMKVELQHLNRNKGVPERLLLTLKVAAPARVKIKRRTGGFLSKPITLFGPPLVEPMNIADRERYWIRSDELVFVERLFARAEVAPALEPNLIAGFDVVDLQPKQLRILRAIDDRTVRKRFNRPATSFRRDIELIETIAAEEWRLAVTIIEALGLRGYEAT